MCFSVRNLGHSCSCYQFPFRRSRILLGTNPQFWWWVLMGCNTHLSSFILINSSMTHFVLTKHDETTYIKSPFLVAWIPVFRFIKLYEIPKLAVCVLLQPLKTHGISWSMPSNGETSPVAGSAWRYGHPLIFPGKDWHSWWVNQIYVEFLKGYTNKKIYKL